MRWQNVKHYLDSHGVSYTTIPSSLAFSALDTDDGPPRLCRCMAKAAFFWLDGVPAVAVLPCRRAMEQNPVNRLEPTLRFVKALREATFQLEGGEAPRLAAFARKKPARTSL